MRLIIFIVCMITILFSNSYAEEGASMSKWRSFMNWFSPPKDYYIPLVMVPIDISNKGIVSKYQVKHKYEGDYMVGIVLDKFNNELYFEQTEKYKIKLIMDVKFYSDNNALLFHKLIKEGYCPIIGLNGSGFDFLLYNAPSNLPINKELICEVTIIAADKYLSDNYGPIKLSIRKIADK